MAMDGDAPSAGEVTRLLRAASTGEGEPRAELLEHIYNELRNVADRAMGGENPEHTLQPTALVHEAWLKLFQGEPIDFQDRRHLLAVSARAMRRILVDHARTRKRAKRGGSWERDAVAIEEQALLTPQGDTVDGFDLVALEEALQALEKEAPRTAQVVELRYFGGFSVEDTSHALEISESTVAREWRFARAWLMKRLGSS